MLSKSFDYKTLIVPTRVFASAAFRKAHEVEAQEQKMLGPYRAMMSIMKMFVTFKTCDDPSLQGAEFDEFCSALSKCHIGFIKEMKALQLSTSASLGCAKLAFQSFPQATTNQIGLVFNFGTGGGKASGFRQSGNAIQTLFDIKPRENAPSPNALVIGDYKPAGSISHKDPVQDTSDMQDLIKATMDAIAQLGPETTVVFASVFVTGPLREFICAAGPTGAKNPTTQALSEYMLPITTQWPHLFAEGHSTFALDQNSEALFENMACTLMYETLAAAEYIDKCEVVDGTCCGIGNGSCQALLGFMANIGMKKLQSDDFDPYWMRDAMVAHLQTPQAMQEINAFVDNVKRIVASGKRPVIPFKSGFALVFDNPKLAQSMFDAFAKSDNMFSRLDSIDYKRYEHMAKRAGEIARISLWLARECVGLASECKPALDFKNTALIQKLEERFHTEHEGDESEEDVAQSINIHII